MNDTFLKACRGEKTDYTPVWIMRQAGRYLPEYLKVREKVDFLTLCKTPHLAAEVTIQPLDILRVDAAILFSDILIPLEPMGFKLQFSETKGPIIHNPVSTADDIKRLRNINPEEDLPFVIETIRILLKNISVPLIGFAGAPFTVATYLIEGGSSKNFLKTKRMLYQSTEDFLELMELITDNTIKYLLSQIKAGVHAIQLFDTWAGILTPYDFSKYSLPYIKRIISAIDHSVPIIYFAFNSSSLLDLIKNLSAEVIGIDWRIEISNAIKRLGKTACVQGNLDPCILFGDEELIKERVLRILKGAKKAKGHIFNLGHGILPETPVNKAIFMVETVHNLSMS
ncbi:MAG: uroporphyrinogen decarboxylase [Thermodesulfovibrionales bacterium]|nr:uroporphyrinogen decarboxylase [Thermodesulfovibrionales bacterium]